MRTLVVGGNVKGENRSSSVVRRLADTLKANVCNGVLPDSISGHDLVIWMPNISNEYEKDYPVKDRGSVLICSKVMREGYTSIDSISRIFKMSGNAVIEIRKIEDLFWFKVMDALGNQWAEETHSIWRLSEIIEEFYEWTKGSVRKSLSYKGTRTVEFCEEKEVLEDFLTINSKIALDVAGSCGNRYFGNYSTRCTKLFPTCREDNYILMSPRNTDKRYLTVDDFVVCELGNEDLGYSDGYHGDRKPSVDAPVQLEIYKQFPNINFMIHGHAGIKGSPTTKHYFPCGDMREVDEACELIKQQSGKTGAINLLNHGFLIFSEDLDGLQGYEFTGIKRR